LRVSSAPLPPTRQLSQPKFAAALLLIAFVAMATVGFVTRKGIGLSRDSETYLAAARQLVAGKGFSIPSGSDASQPLTHYPPLYPIVLAGLAKLGLDVRSAARVLNMTMFAGSVLMAGLIFRRGLGLSRLASLMGAALVAASVDLLCTYSQVWSEGPFIFLMLAAWFLLGLFIDERRRATLIGAALAVALATLTRYAGLGLAIACGAALLIYGQRSLRQRMADLALFGAISCMPIAAWFLRNITHTGSAANRQLIFHPPDGKRLHAGIETIADWMWPSPSPNHWRMWSGFGVGLALLVIACASARNARADGRTGLAAKGAAGVVACFTVAYLLFVLASVSFVDASTQLDFRILAPLHLSLLIGIFAELARSSLPPTAGWWSRAWPVILASAGGIVLAGQTIRSALWAHQADQEGIGFVTRKWRDSDLVQYADKLPPGALIYSNRAALIRLNTDRAVKSLPTMTDPSTLQPQARVHSRLLAVQHELENSDGYIFYFHTMLHPEFIPEDQLVHDLNLELLHADSDGDVYQVRTKTRQARRKSAP